MKVSILWLLVLAALWTNAAEWTVSTDIDEFEETTTVTAMSPTVRGKPYGWSNLVVRCTDGSKLEAYFIYDYLNRPSDDGDPIRIKFGDRKPHMQHVSTSRSGKGLFISNHAMPASLRRRLGTSAELLELEADLKKLAVEKFASDVITEPSLLTRFDYYGEGRVTIEYSLNGASKVVTEVLEACGVEKGKSDPPTAPAHLTAGKETAK